MTEPQLGEQLNAETLRIAKIIIDMPVRPDTTGKMFEMGCHLSSACKAAIDNDIPAMQRALKCLKEYRND